MPSIQIKRGTSSALSSNNPIIPTGELLFATDTLILKVGDGSSTWSQLNPIAVSGVAGGDLTGNYPNPTLTSIGTSGTYTKVTTDSKGRVSSGTTLSAGDLPSHNHSGSDINSGTISVNRLASSGTPSSSTFLRGDGSWAAAGSSSASDLTSGTLAIGRLPTPSTTQAQNASALYASTPTATLQQMAKWKIFDLGSGFASNTVGSGSVFTNVIVQIQTGGTANSSYLLRLANEYYTMIGYANSASGYSGSTYWSRPEAFAFRIYPNLASANGVFRWQFGKAQGTTTVGRMASAGIGIELQFVNSTTYRLWLLAHNGTSLTATDTSINLRQNSVYDFVLSSDATGNVTALVNDGAVANYTITGGPTTGGLGGITAEILNGTDAVGQSVHMYRYLFWTGLS
jgi:hypothetical protein